MKHTHDAHKLVFASLKRMSSIGNMIKLPEVGCSKKIFIYFYAIFNLQKNGSS